MQEIPYGGQVLHLRGGYPKYPRKSQNYILGGVFPSKEVC